MQTWWTSIIWHQSRLWVSIGQYLYIYIYREREREIQSFKDLWVLSKKHKKLHQKRHLTEPLLHPFLCPISPRGQGTILVLVKLRESHTVCMFTCFLVLVVPPTWLREPTAFALSASLVSYLCLVLVCFADLICPNCLHIIGTLSFSTFSALQHLSTSFIINTHVWSQDLAHTQITDLQVLNGHLRISTAFLLLQCSHC